jgi:hypothetical protein
MTMKKFVLVFGLMILFLFSASAKDTVRLFGKITDTNAMPADSVSVILMDKKLDNLYESLTDKDGYFSMNVMKGTYLCLYAIRLKDGGKAKMDCWAWDVTLFKDRNIDMNMNMN